MTEELETLIQNTLYYQHHEQGFSWFSSNLITLIKPSVPMRMLLR